MGLESFKAKLQRFNDKAQSAVESGAKKASSALDNAKEKAAKDKEARAIKAEEEKAEMFNTLLQANFELEEKKKFIKKEIRKAQCEDPKESLRRRAVIAEKYAKHASDFASAAVEESSRAYEEANKLRKEYEEFCAKAEAEEPVSQAQPEEGGQEAQEDATANQEQ